jgi:hypothetical protein
LKGWICLEWELVQQDYHLLNNYRKTRETFFSHLDQEIMDSGMGSMGA